MDKLISLSIENIKGIDSKSFSLDLFPNKPCIWVAPNGFGKSSIACAFKSLNNKRIALDEKNYHKNNEALKPRIEIALDSELFEATDSSNTISSKFDVFVISSPVYAKATSRNMGSFSATSASLEVSPIVLIDSIPEKKDFNYKIASMKSGFGTNGKILPSAAELLKNKDFLYRFEKQIDKTAFDKKKTYITPVDQTISKINEQKGKEEDVKKWVADNLINDFDAITPLRKLAELASKFTDVSRIDNYLLAYQIVKLSKNSAFSEALAYQLYLREREFFDGLLNSINSTRHKIQTEEIHSKKKTSLVVNFPKADDVSNGQRDIMSLITQLQKAKRKFSKTHCILVIDEIFDYLDDANLVSFQYYVTKLIGEFKEQGRFIYPILLTHLDPAYFNHFCFNKHRLQIRYLARNAKRKTSALLKLVKHRDDNSIKEIVSTHHFHYHPDEANLESEFEALKLEKIWGKSHSLYKLVEDERQNYLSDKVYDPIGVLLAVRIKIEQTVYQRLSSEHQIEFLKTHKSNTKLDYCSEQGIEIPEIFYLLGIIYNDDLHWREQRDYETPLISKLNNPTIRQMIKDLPSPADSTL